MPLIPRKKGYPPDQGLGCDERILAFQRRIPLTKFCIAASGGRCDIDLAVTLEKEKDRSSFSVREPLLSQQLFLGHSRVINLPSFAFQVIAMLPTIQVVNKNVGID